MDKGAKMLIRVVLVALLLGGLVVVLNPDYRAAARAWANGSWPDSPLWQSNADYYSEVSYDVEGAGHDTE